MHLQSTIHSLIQLSSRTRTHMLISLFLFMELIVFNSFNIENCVSLLLVALRCSVLSLSQCCTWLCVGRMMILDVTMSIIVTISVSWSFIIIIIYTFWSYFLFRFICVFSLVCFYSFYSTLVNHQNYSKMLWTRHHANYVGDICVYLILFEWVKLCPHNKCVTFKCCSSSSVFFSSRRHKCNIV